MRGARECPPPRQGLQGPPGPYCRQKGGSFGQRTATALSAPPGLLPALALRSPMLAVRRDFRHFVTAITGGGWVLCEVKALSHGTKGQSNGYHRFDYCRRDRIRRLVGLYGCAVE